MMQETVKGRFPLEFLTLSLILMATILGCVHSVRERVSTKSREEKDISALEGEIDLLEEMLRAHLELAANARDTIREGYKEALKVGDRSSQSREARRYQRYLIRLKECLGNELDAVEAELKLHSKIIKADYREMIEQGKN